MDQTDNSEKKERDKQHEKNKEEDKKEFAELFMSLADTDDESDTDKLDFVPKKKAPNCKMEQ